MLVRYLLRVCAIVSGVLLLWLFCHAAFGQSTCPGGVCPGRPQPHIQGQWRRWEPSAPILPTLPQRTQPEPFRDFHPTYPLPAQAAEVETKTKMPAVVRVSVADGRGGRDMATGTIIARDDGRAYVLTCWHLFRDSGTGSNVHPTVHMAAASAQANILGVDQMDDLALIEIRDPGIEPIPVADEPAALGDEVQAVGYVSGRQFTVYQGRILKWVTPRRDRGEPGDWAEVSCTSRPGQSGGPIVFRGKLVGTITGGDGGPCTGPHLRRVKAFLRVTLPPYKQRPKAVAPLPAAPRRPLTPLQSALPIPETIPVLWLTPLPSATEPGQNSAGISAVAPSGTPGATDGGGAIADRRLENTLRQHGEEIRTAQQLARDALAAARQIVVRDGVDGKDGRDGLDGKPGGTGPPGKDADVGPLAEQLDALAARFGTAAGPGGAAVAAVAAPALSGIVPALAGGVLAGLPVAGIGLWLVRRAVNRLGIYRIPNPQSPIPASIIPIVRDTPPSPQVVARDSTYVPVEIATVEQEAIEWAMDRHARDFPGAIGTIETIKAAAKQYASGHPRRRQLA